MEDKSIIQEMIKGQDVAEVRQFAKMLYNTCLLYTSRCV